MLALMHGALLGAALAASVFIYAFWRTKQFKPGFFAAQTAFVVSTAIVWLFEYMFKSAHTGYLGGYGYMVFASGVGLLLAAGALTGINRRGEPDSDYSDHTASHHATSDRSSPHQAAPVGFLGAALVVLLIVGFAGTWCYNVVGTGNNARWAALGNITMAPAKAKPVLPDTDPNEMVTMDVHLAYTRAHQALGSGGNNLGSYYDIIENEGVQQWVAGRNWFVFPLELNGLMEQEGWGTHQIACGAGFIAVPADDPNADVKIESGLCLKYLPRSSFSLNLQRYVYTHGYSDGQLIDPTIEADDNWHPYFTITYVQPAFTVGGTKVVKVLIVDPANGEIKAYAPDKVPAWVDRVVSEDMVNDWAGRFAKHGKVPDFWNVNGAGQMKVDTVRLVNIHGEHQVWQVPLLANNGGAVSTNGIVLYDTRAAKGTFYESEGASGLASSETLKAAFENVSQNTRGWTVEAIQWYSIQGVPTWMAIYSKNVATGTDTRTVFAGIGFLDARSTTPADVQFGLSKEAALDAYKDWLSHRSSGGQVSEVVHSQALSGVVLRIGQDVLANNQSTYTIVLKGDVRVFDVSHNLNPLLPVVRDGDSISITFDEPTKPTSDNRRTVEAFSDITLNGALKDHSKD